jgi:peptidoglycan/LPS O-acetylase OafA/YrhL
MRMTPSPPLRAGKTDRLVVLDGLRGVAAFAVILDHVPSESLRALLPGRYLAVDFFLVLSGLVLARAYGTQLEKPGMAWSFIKARIIRLYPFYLVGLLFGLSVATLLAYLQWSEYGYSGIAVGLVFGLLFLPDPATMHTDAETLFPLNPPTWTVFMELVVNIIYATTIRFLRQNVLIVVLGILGVACAISIMSSEDLGPGWKWSHLETGLVRVLFTFLMGVCLQRVLHHAKAFTVPAWIAFALLIIIMAFPASEALRRPYDALTALVLMPALIFVSANARVSGFFSRLCIWLGAVSYGVYILHYPIYLGLNTIMVGLDIQVFGFATVALTALISAGTAQLVAKLFEKPVRQLLSRRFLPSKPATPR